MTEALYPAPAAVGRVALAWCLVLLAACGGDGEAGPLRLVEAGRETGLAGFHHAGGRPDKAFLPDTTGSGLCAFDYDLDGDDDLYLVNGNDPQADAASFPRDALYRNDGGRFTDVTSAAGLGSPRWGQGCAVGDVDGDGLPDLYVTNLMEPDLLYRNQGDGTFTEVTRAAGLGDAGWGTGAVFLDLEGDGDEDLYVARYVDFDWAPELAGFPCSWRGLAVACGPRGLPASRDLVYCNDGRGAFSECASERIEAAPEAAYGLGVLAADFDGDGDRDLYVANDATPNHYYENREGRLWERGLEAGLALNGAGEAEASMGIGWLDGSLYLTNFSLETDTLYAPAAGGGWEDGTAGTGIARASHRNLSWGVAAFDPDLDGDLDLYVASGHIYPQVEQAPDLGLSYHQADLFLRNLGDGRFRSEPDVLPEGVRARGGRGVAVLDLEGDGDPDLVVNNLDGPPTVLRAVGAEGRPSVIPPEESVPRGGSYLSTHGRAPRGPRP